MKKTKKTLWATLTFKDGRKRILASYNSTKVLDGMVWVSSENGEGFIFPKEIIDTIEIKEDIT